MTMRHCWGTKIEVHEAEGNNLADLLVEAANLIRNKDELYAEVHTYPGSDTDYVVQVMLHGIA